MPETLEQPTDAPSLDLLRSQAWALYNAGMLTNREREAVHDRINLRDMRLKAVARDARA